MTEKPDILEKERDLCETCVYCDWGRCWAGVKDIDRDSPVKLYGPVPICVDYRRVSNAEEK